MANGTEGGVAQAFRTGNLSCSLGSYRDNVLKELAELRTKDFVTRLWRKDATLWTGSDESSWLGWLDIVAEQLQKQDEFAAVARLVKEAKFQSAVLLGMGGSSLCVEVMRTTFGDQADHPKMFVLDSVVPEQVASVRKQIDPAKTLFIVASKSGSTTEPNVLCQYFFEEAKKAVGDKAGQHFIAITDPGSSMEQRAKDWKFLKICYGIPSIGGRFSALSHFGMVPATVMGLDTTKLLTTADTMVTQCKDSDPEKNPGVFLGTVMGVLARDAQKNKVTIITSPGVVSVGTWLEQLIAESTGKDGKGLIPVAGETTAAPEEYGEDRLFVHVRIASNACTLQDRKVDLIEQAGHPVVRIELKDVYEVGAEFFRWEVATATAGSILGINAFNQPNVQESKDFTKDYLKDYVESGSLPQNTLILEESGFKVFADEENAKRYAPGGTTTLPELLKAFLASIQAGDYFATNAYIECCEELSEIIQQPRDQVKAKRKVATTVGFGPRFLHSTGQLHKGGPNCGVFLQITSDDAEDVAIPGEKFTFGVLKEAQALGDFKALSSRHRRLVRVHLPKDVKTALKMLADKLSDAI